MATQPGIASQLVGRQAELAVVQDRIDAVLAGDGGVVLISGEAGVGKSRLVAEILDRFARAAPDSLALTGACFEGDRALAYAPLLDLVRGCLTFQQPVDVEHLIETDPAAFVALLPELQTRFPDVQPLGGSEPEQEKRRLFQALLGLFVRLAGGRPLIIVFEDLHWSDDTSLEFLILFARAIQTLPALLVCTYRSEEEQPALRRALVEVERARLGVELSLPRLSSGEVDLLLRDIFDQPYPIRPDFLQAIYALTDGNPFFVEEIVRSLIAAGDIYEASGRWTRKDMAQLRIPRSVQDALDRRAAHLDETALQALASAAVIGQRFDFTLLQRLTGLPEPDLVEALRALIGAGLVGEDSADRFRFRHALIRQTVYEGLLARERRIRHGQAAEAIEELHAGSPERWLADLAYHFNAAERWDNAFAYATAAAERAESLFAPYAVIEHIDRALEAYEHLGREAPARIMRQRGRAHETLGDFEAARRDFHAALEIAREAGDLRAEWETLVDIGRSWEGLDYTQAGNWFERALDLARRLDDPVALAHSLNRVGTWHLNSERVDEARTAHLEALAIFEEIGDEPGIAATLDYLGIAADLGGDLIEMRARFEQAARLFERLGDRQGLASTLATMGSLSSMAVFDTVVVPASASEAEALAWGTRGLQLAREVGWRAGEAYALVVLAMTRVARADYGEALRLTTEARDVASEIQHQEWLSTAHGSFGTLYLDLLASEPAIEHLERATTIALASGSFHFLHTYSGILIDAFIEHGQIERAADTLRGFAPDMPMKTFGQRRLWAARARWDLAEGNADEALAIVDRLYASGRNVTEPKDIPLLAALRGHALWSLSRHAGAEEAFQAASEGHAALGQLGKLWRVHLDLARLYHSQEREEEAWRTIEAAREIVERIAARIPDEALRQDFLAKTAELFDAVDGGDHAPPTALDSLTPREREVALLVARGLSNRQIADELFIGERTVETHVGSILGKLSLDSRTQVAAWVFEHRAAGTRQSPAAPRSSD